MNRSASHLDKSSLANAVALLDWEATPLPTS
jgi:hypothetical protein